SLPGCFTPTEILDAWEAGADIVQVFPATALGPAFFRDIRGPLPQIKLMPTGGVTLDNAGDWIRAGAVAVGVGSALLDSAAISAGQFGTITANARRVVASVSKAREARGRAKSSRSASTRCGGARPARLRALPPVGDLHGDLRRRRSQRRRQPGAVRTRQLVCHAAADARDRRGGGQGAPH